MHIHAHARDECALKERRDHRHEERGASSLYLPRSAWPALLSERNDEWLVQPRYLSAESTTLILAAARFEEPSLEQDELPRQAAALHAA